MRPTLPSLARLTPQPQPPPLSIGGKPMYNNVAHGSQPHLHQQQQYHLQRHDSRDYLMDRGDGTATPTPTSPNTLSRMEDFAAAAAASSLAPPQPMATDLTRRPSVAIGGVRSPKEMPTTAAAVNHQQMAYPQRSLLFLVLCFI